VSAGEKPGTGPGGVSARQAAGDGPSGGGRPPVLCERCVRHAGQPLHWCIFLVVSGGRAAACECPCERRA
jgi:hypothetical protein